MKKTYQWNFYMSISLQIIIGIDIINRTLNNPLNFLFLFGLYLVVVVNDRLRAHGFCKSLKAYYISIFIAMVLGLIIAINIEGYIYTYFFIILFELIIYTEGKVSRLLIGIEVLFWFILLGTRIFSLKDISNLELTRIDILDLAMTLQLLVFYIVTMFGYKALRLEKRKVDKLNRELASSNNILLEQSAEIEELTRRTERNRVAEEIHDNLGHSLIALSMNLDVAEKTMDTDIIKAKQLVSKSHILGKESMENLRMAVYALKNERIDTFKSSLKLIIENLESTGNILVETNIDEGVEELLPEYKNIIYTSIKESLTNSIKHGKADRVNIDIKIHNDYIKALIKDNGVGCKDLVKGNGLLGIEKRISEFGGNVKYISSENQGFKLEIDLIIAY